MYYYLCSTCVGEEAAIYSEADYTISFYGTVQCSTINTGVGPSKGLDIGVYKLKPSRERRATLNCWASTNIQTVQAKAKHQNDQTRKRPRICKRMPSVVQSDSRTESDARSRLALFCSICHNPIVRGWLSSCLAGSFRPFEHLDS